MPRLPLPPQVYVGLGGWGFSLSLPTSPLLQYQLVALAVAVIGFAFLTPSAQALISRRSDPRTQGEILGVNQSASALARILGPMLGVSLFFATPSHILPYLAGAVLLVVVFLLALTPTVSREKT